MENHAFQNSVKSGQQRSQKSTDFKKVSLITTSVSKLLSFSDQDIG